MKNPSLPYVVIIGRINAGKSALFNRLTDTTKAIVSNIPGTTRDYNISKVTWEHATFNLVDTGGVNIDVLKDSILALTKPSKKLTIRTKRRPAGDPSLSSGEFEQAIIAQTSRALTKANVILMVTDAQAGMMPEDRQLAQVLQKLSTPVILVCNKVDGPKWRAETADFYQLGLGQPNLVSAGNGSGTGDLLDAIVKKLPKKAAASEVEVDESVSEIKPIRLAVIGKPNAGKSSLVNQLLNEERVIVSPVPHTTREPQDTELVYNDQPITLIDTAGLRKKGATKPGIERISAHKTIQTIEQADVALLVTEANVPLTAQDSRLAGLIRDNQTSVIIVANKWDALSNKTTHTADEVETYYRRILAHLQWAPIIFVSALTGFNVKKILELVMHVHQGRQQKIEQEALDGILKSIVKQQHPVKAGGHANPTIYKLSQVRSNPPVFTVAIGTKQSLHFSYLRYIENRLRNHFGFEGTPLTIEVITVGKHKPKN